MMTRESTGTCSCEWVEGISTKTLIIYSHSCKKKIVVIMHEPIRLNFVRLNKMLKIFQNYPWSIINWNSASHELLLVQLIIWHPSSHQFYAAEQTNFPSCFLETYPIPFLRMCIPNVGLKSHNLAPYVFKPRDAPPPFFDKVTYIHTHICQDSHITLLPEWPT